MTESACSTDDRDTSFFPSFKKNQSLSLGKLGKVGTYHCILMVSISILVFVLVLLYPTLMYHLIFLESPFAPPTKARPLHIITVTKKNQTRWLQLQTKTAECRPHVSSARAHFSATLGISRKGIIASMICSSQIFSGPVHANESTRTFWRHGSHRKISPSKDLLLMRLCIPGNT